MINQCKDVLKNFFCIARRAIPPLHPEGYVFVIIFAAVTIAVYLVSSTIGCVLLVATLWCAYFFRDPKRVTPVGDSLVVSPADGLVQKIEKVAAPEELGLEDEGERYRVSIFLNVMDVHVNRAPVSGSVTQANYHPGKFLSANLDKASEENERQTIVITTSEGKTVVCVQIAGLVARRIVCDVKEGDQVEGGARYGIIRFGSRVDVYLPVGVNPLVAEGQYMLGGETVVADLVGGYEERAGVVR